ncbi:MAG: sigma-54-dependent Fis family transcriptional regulator [Candidatus Aminicenantes bacterium]|nr:MAG: sigma-54-dependent Fis family transcriptional regulator [Candidatus Aminicenantes bacterium]
MWANIKILIIEDEIALRTSLKKLIELRKYQVDEAEDFVSAAKKIRYYDYDIFLLDLKLPDGNGLQLLKKYKSKMEKKTIIMTAHATIPSAVDAIKSGAFYYLEKPLDEELLFIQMEKILGLTQLREKNLTLKRELTTEHSSDEIVYESKQMAEIVSLAKKFARTDDIVLIQGNTGVGKEIMAKFIHKNSKRKDKTFLPINCSTIPEQLFESELFGFKKGAFTGASENYSGRFIQANKGTLFLDEIGEIPMHLQAKLLRVLEEEEIYQLGNNQPQKVDVRVIAATNQDLWKEVRADRFRKDLYFRLKGTMVHIPPLCERKEDIMPLVWHFISIFNNLFEKTINRITKEAEAYLIEYPWEGNVRELKNTIKSIFTFKNSDAITVKDLMLTLHVNNRETKKSFVALQEHELRYIKEVLEANQFNIKKTAKILDISRSRLYRKLKLLEIDINEELDGEIENG